MTLARTMSKNCRLKYYLAQNIYLVKISSAAMEARETTQASSNDTCTTSRGGSTTGSTTTSGEKIWREKTLSGDVGNCQQQAVQQHQRHLYS